MDSTRPNPGPASTLTGLEPVTAAPAGSQLPARGRLRRLIFGPPRDVKDPGTYHAVSLAALFAWVGLRAATRIHDSIPSVSK